MTKKTLILDDVEVDTIRAALVSQREMLEVFKGMRRTTPEEKELYSLKIRDLNRALESLEGHS